MSPQKHESLGRASVKPAARQIEAEATVEYRLDEPVTLPSKSRQYKTVTGDRVVWRHIVTGPDAVVSDHEYLSATLFDAKHRNAEIVDFRDGKPDRPIPDWCPLPPLGWNEQVEKFRDELAVRAVTR